MVDSIDDRYPSGYHAEPECVHEWIPLYDDLRQVAKGEEPKEEVCIYCHKIQSTDIPF